MSENQNLYKNYGIAKNNLLGYCPFSTKKSLWKEECSNDICNCETNLESQKKYSQGVVGLVDKETGKIKKITYVPRTVYSRSAILLAIFTPPLIGYLIYSFYAISLIAFVFSLNDEVRNIIMLPFIVFTILVLSIIFISRRSFQVLSYFFKPEKKIKKEIKEYCKKNNIPYAKKLT